MSFRPGHCAVPDAELAICVLRFVCDMDAHLKQKKADVAEHLGMFRHVGLLVNEPPGTAGLSFT
jgi:hypothetical protein